MQIEKGIQMPPKSELIRTLRMMEVGDSVLSDMTHESTRSTASKVKREKGWDFTVRKIARDGIRVWRVA
jgi:hypothetical protein